MKSRQQLAAIFNKVKAAGVAYMDDINPIVEAGFPFVGELAKVLRIDAVEVKAKADAGRIGFGKFNEAWRGLKLEMS